MMRVPVLGVLLSAMIGSAALAIGAYDRVPEAVATGKPRSCVPIASLRQSHVRDDRTIDFMTGNRTGYRNVLPNACPGLGAERRFSYATSLSQLCSTDIITVFYQTGAPRGASCGLGQFQPVTLPKKG